MGRFTVDVEIANHVDVINAQSGVIDPGEVRRVVIKALVDSGATRLVLPAATAKKLGLPVKKDKLQVKYADGRRKWRAEVEEAHLYLLGRDGVFKAIVEPDRETALLGAIVLEDFDLLVDCTKGRLLPRDPNGVLAEIE